VLCHGPVRVPGDAAPGKAVLRFALPKESRYTSVPTDLPVKLVGTAKGP